MPVSTNANVTSLDTILRKRCKIQIINWMTFRFFPSNKDGHFFQKSGLKSMVDPLPLPMNFQVKMPDFLSATVMLEEASQMF